MTFCLDGKKLANNLLKELSQQVSQLPRPPHLAVLLIGDDPASHLYVNLKAKAATKTGLRVTKVMLPTKTNQPTLLKLIQDFNQQPDIDAILVQLPLPKHLDESIIIQTIKPSKDADGFQPINIQKFLNGQNQFIPGLIEGIIKLINLSKKNLNGGQACLLVNSPQFGQPLEKALINMGLKVNLLKNKTDNILAQADLVISALGQPHYLTINDFKDEAIIIDVGTTKINSHLLGDVDPNNPLNKPIFLTPVPGGVGPVTVAMLLWSVYRLTIKNLSSNI
ncbi:bifunctional 5,10-methylenetetrahydrofolate dehydrogenase/5,10-methenyltetrahydrofolate cyclohydrolase [Patescibacteria group bacterium]|nr:bifunctional 5,10-methylenetetrahydrofolate dehydrogenase/5,10-methenyltetrahydrofolate cyclohydrolase [Patescibacteria group bacterium]